MGVIPSRLGFGLVCLPSLGSASSGSIWDDYMVARGDGWKDMCDHTVMSTQPADCTQAQRGATSLGELGYKPPPSDWGTSRSFGTISGSLSTLQANASLAPPNLSFHLMHLPPSCCVMLLHCHSAFSIVNQCFTTVTQLKGSTITEKKLGVSTYSKASGQEL